MITYSDFKFKSTSIINAFEVPMSEAYKVSLGDEEIPVYTCRISKYPFNVWWQGHQRSLDQTEQVSYINLVSDEPVKLTIEPLSKKNFDRVMIKPYSKKIPHKVKDGKISMRLEKSGAYVLELDDYHGLLYIFNNRPVPCESPEKVTHYFGPGVDFAERLTLKSNDSVYLHKDALVYGCVYAKDAENIKIYGNGVFDDSFEERHNRHCMTPFTNGNVKLYDCKNVTMQGVGYTNSALWCVNLFHCENVIIDGINVFGQWRYNTDGIDMMNCRDIVIRNSFIHSFDDTIVVKGIDPYAYDGNRNILTENCVLWCDWGKTCEIGLETAAPEYENIIFRNIDILRGGNTSCDIQNGDWADVHDILFENIRIELESFYTPSVIQLTDDTVYEYDKENGIEISNVLMVANRRFREAYPFVNFDGFTIPSPGASTYASVHDVTVRDIYIYADDEIMSRFGKGCVRVNVSNMFETTEYNNIVVENLYLNGERVEPSEVEKTFKGVDESVITVK